MRRNQERMKERDERTGGGRGGRKEEGRVGFILPAVAARRQENCCIRSLCQIGEREKEREEKERGFFIYVCA